MALSPLNAALRDRSGCINSSDPLVSFLYILMRDHVTPGSVEDILQNHVEGEDESEFCNGYLASYAKDIANRLKRD